MATSKKHIRGPFPGLKLSSTIGVQALKVVAYQTPVGSSQSDSITIPPAVPLGVMTGSASSSSVQQEGQDNSQGPQPHVSAQSSRQMRGHSKRSLELCVYTGKYTRTLGEIDTSVPTSDGALFEKIRAEYALVRKKGRQNRRNNKNRLVRWISSVLFLEPHGASFIKVRVNKPSK
jgi:hypothetical protein